MKKMFFTLFFIASIFSVIAQEKPRVAVVTLQVTNKVNLQIPDINPRNPPRILTLQEMLSNADIIVGAITTEVVNTNRFRVVERSRIDKIMREQGFQRSSLTSEQVVKVGRLLGVNKIITGEYSEDGYNSTVNIRLIDVETGDIEAAASYQFNSRYLVDLSKTLVKQLLR